MMRAAIVAAIVAAVILGVYAAGLYVGATFAQARTDAQRKLARAERLADPAATCTLTYPCDLYDNKTIQQPRKSKP